MKQVISINGNSTILRLDNGEDVIKELVEFCDKNHIPAAHFTGLGACKSVTLSFYDLKQKKYLDKKFDQDLEIVSLTGNVAKVKDNTIIHTHGVFSDNLYQAIGGHVKQLIVSATCEIHLTALKIKMERGYDKKTGLNLLQ